MGEFIVKKILLLIVFVICIGVTYATNTSNLTMGMMSSTPENILFKDYPAVADNPGLTMYGNYKTGLFTGSSTYEFDITVPDGINGLSPSLGISYSSSSMLARPGIVGAGWQLSQDMVIRDINYTPNDMSDDEFKLLFGGSAYDLVYNESEGLWHTKIESFIKIVNLSSGLNHNSEYWVLYTKDGTEFRFGYTNESELESNTGKNYSLEWRLDKITDVLDNQIYFNYSENPNANDYGFSYLREISYNNDMSKKIVFDYESSDRPDKRLIFLQGNKNTISRRLTDISVFSDEQLVRRYRLNYSTISSSMTSLESIKEYGNDNSSLYYELSYDYNEVTCNYTNYTDMWKPPVYFYGDYPTDHENAHIIMDANNDGFDDIFRAEIYYLGGFINNKSGGWQYGTSHNSLPRGVVFEYTSNNYVSTGMRIGDVNGDGFIDIMYSSYYDLNEVWLNNGTGWVLNDSWFVPVNFHAVNSNLVDYNGDGLIDIVTASTPYAEHVMISKYKNNGTGWVSDGSFIYQGTLRGFLDVNGDGMVDMLTGYPSRSYMAFWLNNGGNWASSNQYPTISYVGDDPNFIDLNGDSLVDIFDDYYTNINTGSGWTTNSTWYIDEPAYHEWGDVNGDGFTDVMVSYDRLYTNMDINYSIIRDRTIPYFLNYTETAYGGETIIEYTKSTDIDNSIDGVSQLGHNVWIVDNITKDNGLNISSVVNYDYLGGSYDYDDREFRGFSRVEESDYFKTKTHWYHQDDVLKGLEYKTQINYSVSVYYVVENKYSIENISGYHIIELDKVSEYTYDGQSYVSKNTSYTYDDYGNVLSVITGDRTESYGYVYNVSAWIVDKVRHFKSDLWEVWYEYDNSSLVSKGLLTRQEMNLTTGDNPVLLYNYDSYGNLISETDALGHETKYYYDSTHVFPSVVVDALGMVVNTTYDLGTGNKLSVADPNGIVTNFTYDVFGRLKKEILAYDSVGSPTKEYWYYIDGSAPEVISVNQKQVGNASYYYDGFGNLVKTLSDGTEGIIKKDIIYDSSFRVAAISDPYYSDAQHTNYSYDPLDRVIKIIKPDGTNTTAEYKLWNATVYDANGNRKRYSFDQHGQIIAVYEFIVGSEYKTAYSYDDSGSLLSITDALGNSFSYSYDSLGRKVYENDPDKGELSYTYDKNGNLVLVNDNSIIVNMSYDSLGRLISKNGTVNYHYEDLRLDSVDYFDYHINYTYDDRYRVVSVEDNGFGLEYSYDSADHLIGVVYPDGSVVNYTYNSQGVVSNGLVSLGYNAMGQIANRSYENGLVSELDYDSLNRLSDIKTSGLQLLSYEYDSVGNIVGVNDSGLLSSMVYDDLDRLVHASKPGVFDQRYEYDIIGRITGLSGATNATYEYANGPLHAPSSFGQLDPNRILVKNSTGGITAWLGDYGNIWINGKLYQENDCNLTDSDEFVIAVNGTPIFVIEKESGDLFIAGRIYQIQSSINETSGNDFIIRKDGEIMLLVDSVGSIYMKGSLKNYYDSDMVFKDSFGDIVAHIDDYGNVVLAGSLEESSTHSRTSSPEWIINSGGDDVLILDQSSGSLYIDGTLSAVSNVTGSEFVYEDVFSVDSSGNVQITGSLVENNTFSSEKLKYDSRGNLISDYSYNYVYDDFGQLSVVMDGDSVIERYYYDHTGNRIKKVAGDETTYYAGDFVRIVNSSGTFDTLYYYLNGVMVAKNSSGVVSYYHPDHLGSTTLVTDISGAVVEDIDYLPYGGLIGASAQDRLYEGKELDDTGLEYFGARYYNPEIRIFTQVDPVMDIYNPQNLNRYSFELNNPVKFVDPDGRFVDLIADIGFIVYDIITIAEEPNSVENWVALGADVTCAVIPIGTGGGAAVRGISKADEVIDGAKIVDQTLDVVKTTDNSRDIAMATAISSNSKKTNNVDFYVDSYGNTLKNDKGGTLQYSTSVNKKGQTYNIVETTYKNGDPYQSIHYEPGNWHGHQSQAIHPNARGNVNHGQRMSVNNEPLSTSKVDKAKAHWDVNTK